MNKLVSVSEDSNTYDQRFWFRLTCRISELLFTESDFEVVLPSLVFCCHTLWFVIFWDLLTSQPWEILTIFWDNHFDFSSIHMSLICCLLTLWYLVLLGTVLLFVACDFLCTETVILFVACDSLCIVWDVIIFCCCFGWSLECIKLICLASWSLLVKDSST